MKEKKKSVVQPWGVDMTDAFFFFFLMLILSLNHFIQQLLLFLPRKTFFFAHLFPSSPRSLCLSGCWADWLSGWLAPSPLDALWQFIYTLPVLHWDCGGEREWVRIAEALEKWNLCGGFFFCSSSLLCCWKYLTWAEKKKPLTFISPATTSDHHCCVSSMTLHTWLVYGLGFILVSALCLAQGKDDCIWSELK